MANANKIRSRYWKVAREHGHKSPRRNIKTIGGKPNLQPLTPAQHGKILNTETGNEGNYVLADDVADRDVAEAMNAELASSYLRWYTVRVIFAWGKLDGRYTRIKKVGIYLLSPSGLTEQQTEQLIKLPGQEYQEALTDIRKRVETVRRERQFVLDHEGNNPFQCPVIDRNRLVRETLAMWSRHPVSTQGNIEFRWPDGRIKIVSTREQLLTTEGQEQIFNHVSSILDLMSRGFRFDPKAKVGVDLSTGSLRRYGPDEKWPGDIYRGGPLNED